MLRPQTLALLLLVAVLAAGDAPMAEQSWPAAEAPPPPGLASAPPPLPPPLRLRFGEKQTLRILQLTDMHYGEDDDKDAKTDQVSSRG